MCQHVNLQSISLDDKLKTCKRVSKIFYIRLQHQRDHQVRYQLRHRCLKHKFPETYYWFTEITYEEALILDVMFI